jgi:hypothetical protein
MLQAFAKFLDHPVAAVLREPFVHYVGNHPNDASSHYFGLREAKPNLRAFALFDRRDGGLPSDFVIPSYCWKRREIENYVTSRDVLLKYAAGKIASDLVTRAESNTRIDAMKKALEEMERAQVAFGFDVWGVDIKASEQVLPNVFRLFYKNLGLRNEMNKADFHELVAFLDPAKIDPEVTEVLDRITEILRESP